MFFLKRFSRGEKIGLICWVCFRFGRRWFMTCKLLRLRSNIRDYDWILHQSSLFLSIYCKKKTHSNFIGRQVFGLASYYNLGLTLRTMTRPYTHVAFFVHYCLKRSRYELVILIMFEKRAWCWTKCFYLRFEASCENGLKLIGFWKSTLRWTKGS